MPFTLKDIEALQARAKIRGYTITPVKGKAPVATKDKKNKYGNHPVEFDGKKFQSTKERDRYITLRMLQAQGEIKDLACQVEFELNEGGTHSIKYIADFVYMENGELIVCDVKGFINKVYKKKKSLMLKVHGIEIKEV